MAKVKKAVTMSDIAEKMQVSTVTVSKALSGQKGVSEDVDFCLEMAQKVGVACVPGTSFFNEKGINNIVRVHFAKKDETLNEALERLSHIKEKMG